MLYTCATCSGKPAPHDRGAGSMQQRVWEHSDQAHLYRLPNTVNSAHNSYLLL